MSRSSRAACIALPVALVLTACQPVTVDDPVTFSTGRDACGASSYWDRVGKNHKAYDFSAPDRPVRILGPDTAMTMDYRTDRLNVDIDRGGTITRIWCG